MLQDAFFWVSLETIGRTMNTMMVEHQNKPTGKG